MTNTHCGARSSAPLSAACLLALMCALATPASAAQPDAVRYDWFEYTGKDAVFGGELPAGHYRNPILAGFYPDPSITRAGDKFYLVNSTFAYYPGIPVFESSDLVHWRQIGHVIDRPTMLNFDGLGISRGVFAPTIEFHDGTFYVVNTAVDSGGNFYVTAQNPAGPWSDPIWLRGLDGIDPSFFFDDDGKVYLLNNGPPEGTPQYDGHRAIWIQEIDLGTRKLVGPRKVLVNGGVDFAKQPIWIEGPHLYKREGWYYLMCAEGGTGPDHSQVILRSRSPWGPFEPYAGNPILTQRDLPPDRFNAVTNAGHADLIEARDGSWWAVFLASRPYERVHYNTGRETFLLPVSWQDGWPIILERGSPIPYVNAGPTFMSGDSQAPLTGNFTWRDDFDARLQPEWLQVRVPMRPWHEVTSAPGWLSIRPLPLGLHELGNPSFLARRQQHLAFEASTALRVPSQGVAAGVAAFQSENYWYFFGVRRRGAQLELFLEQKANGPVRTLATATLPASTQIKLRVSGHSADYAFAYDADGAGWQTLLDDVDGRVLSTERAGGFVGAVVGPYARRENQGIKGNTGE